MKMTFLVFLVICFTLPGVARQSSTGQQPFTITLAADATQVKAGSNVCVKLSLTNNSAQDLDLGGGVNQLTGLDPNYRFEVRNAGGSIAANAVHLHPEVFRATQYSYTVKPNETYSQDQCPSAQFDMRTPGQYTIQAFRLASSTANAGEVASNTVSVTVLPAAPGAAQAPFSIVIAPAGPGFKAGSDVCVDVSVTNNSSQDLDARHIVFNGMDYSVRLEVRDKAGNLVPQRVNTHQDLTGAVQGGIAGPTGSGGLKQNESRVIKECPSKIYDMSAPGEYTIQAFREIPGDPKHGEAGSNIVTTIVQP